jgi:hypothetical protein
MRQFIVLAVMQNNTIRQSFHFEAFEYGFLAGPVMSTQEEKQVYSEIEQYLSDCHLEGVVSFTVTLGDDSTAISATTAKPNIFIQDLLLFHYGLRWETLANNHTAKYSCVEYTGIRFDSEAWFDESMPVAVEICDVVERNGEVITLMAADDLRSMRLACGLPTVPMPVWLQPVSVGLVAVAA